MKYRIQLLGKRNTPTFKYLFIFLLSIPIIVRAQIQNIENPDGYMYPSIILSCDNTNYYSFSNSTTSGREVFALECMDFSPIPNPTDSDDLTFFTTYTNECTDDCYFIFLDTVTSQRNLYLLDGNTFTPIINPVSNSSFFNIIKSEYDNTCYLRYGNPSIGNQIYTINGTTLTAVPSPINFNTFYSIVEDTCSNISYFAYRNTTTNEYQLYNSNGGNLTPILNPTDFNTYSFGSPGGRIVADECTNTCLFKYKNTSTNEIQLYTINGNTLEPRLNPTYFSSFYRIDKNYCNNTSYYIFRNLQTNEQQYFTWDGSSYSSLPNLPTYQRAINIVQDNCNNLCYFVYRNANTDNNELLTYNGISFNGMPSPLVYNSFSSIIYDECNNMCYYRFFNDSGEFQLYTLNGNSFSPVINPVEYNTYYGLEQNECTNECYFIYRNTATNERHAYTLSGNILTPLPQPSEFTSFIKIIKNECLEECYFNYGKQGTFETQLYILNGNNFTPIDSPPDFNSFSRVLLDDCNNNCYFEYTRITIQNNGYLYEFQIYSLIGNILIPITTDSDANIFFYNGNCTYNSLNSLAVLSPNINMQPTSQFACGGDNIFFTVTASGPNDLMYQWQRDCGSGFEDIGVPSSNPNLNLSNVMESDVCTYLVIISSVVAGCSTTSNTATLTGDFSNSNCCNSYNGTLISGNQ